MQRYVLGTPLLAVTGSFVGFVLSALFTHQGGLGLLLASAFAPGFWLAGFVDPLVGVQFWLCVVVSQFLYYFVLLYLFTAWRRRSAIGA